MHPSLSLTCRDEPMSQMHFVGGVRLEKPWNWLADCFRPLQATVQSFWLGVRVESEGGDSPGFDKQEVRPPALQSDDQPLLQLPQWERNAAAEYWLSQLWLTKVSISLRNFFYNMCNYYVTPARTFGSALLIPAFRTLQSCRVPPPHGRASNKGLLFWVLPTCCFGSSCKNSNVHVLLWSRFRCVSLRQIMFFAVALLEPQPVKRKILDSINRYD